MLIPKTQDLIDQAVATETAARIAGDNINGRTAKTVLVDADEVGVADSAASFGLKKFSLTNLWTWVITKLTANAKTVVTNLTTITDNANTTINLANSDSGTIVRCTAATAVTVNVVGDLNAGFNCLVIQAGAGQITFAGTSGATVNSFGALLKTAGQHASASIIRVAASTYNLSGNLA